MAVGIYTTNNIALSTYIPLINCSYILLYIYIYIYI